MRSIERAKRVPIERLLFGLGIRHVGRETAEVFGRRIAWPTRKLTVTEKDLDRPQDSLFGPVEHQVEVMGIAPGDIVKTVLEMGMERLNALHGIGEVNARSFFDWFSDDANAEMLRKMETAGVVALQPAGSSAEQVFEGKIFVLTGTLPTLSREQARAMIKDRGGKVSGSVSKKTDFVLAGEEAGSKLDDAKNLEVKVIDEGEFLKMLG